MLSNNSEIVRWKPLDVVERLTWSRGVGDMGWRCRCEKLRGDCDWRLCPYSSWAFDHRPAKLGMLTQWAYGSVNRGSRSR